MAGAGGVGRPKAHPSVVGRDARERAYARTHPTCERCGHRTEHIHHKEGRGLGGWNRTLSPLEALCSSCHLTEHGQGVPIPT